YFDLKSEDTPVAATSAPVEKAPAPVVPLPMPVTPTPSSVAQVPTPVASTPIEAIGGAGGTHHNAAVKSAATAGVAIKSTPDDAEIELDGKPAGRTPLTLQLNAGDHKITIKKIGFVTWERTLTLTAGSAIVVDAALVLY